MLRTYRGHTYRGPYRGHPLAASGKEATASQGARERAGSSFLSCLTPFDAYAPWFSCLRCRACLASRTSHPSGSRRSLRAAERAPGAILRPRKRIGSRPRSTSGDNRTHGFERSAGHFVRPTPSGCASGDVGSGLVCCINNAISQARPDLFSSSTRFIFLTAHVKLSASPYNGMP